MYVYAVPCTWGILVIGLGTNSSGLGMTSGTQP